MASLTEKIHSRDLSQKEFYAFRAGDQRVFEIVFNKYHHILYRYAFSILKCKTEAEDIVQLPLFACIDLGYPYKSLKAYILICLSLLNGSLQTRLSRRLKSLISRRPIRIKRNCRPHPYSKTSTPRNFTKSYFVVWRTCLQSNGRCID